MSLVYQPFTCVPVMIGVITGGVVSPSPSWWIDTNVDPSRMRPLRTIPAGLSLTRYCTVRGPAPNPSPSINTIQSFSLAAVHPDTAEVLTSIDPLPPACTNDADVGLALKAVATKMWCWPYG